jgi:hypothetical protein
MSPAFVSAVVVLVDIYLLGYHQHMVVMEVVWPVTALYFGSLARFLPLPAPVDQPCRFLVFDASGDAGRLLHLLPDELVVDPKRHQRGTVNKGGNMLLGTRDHGIRPDFISRQHDEEKNNTTPGTKSAS